MMNNLKNTPDAYGLITKSLHWLIGALILFLIGLGLYMTSLEPTAAIFPLYARHKSFGVVVLVLALIRIGWHLYSKRPALAGTFKPWEKKAAEAGHFFLYVAMLGMPLSGWLMSSAAGRSVSVFGLFTLPDLVTKDEALKDIFKETHEVLAYALIATICVHVLAALKHHFINKDGVLRRMLPG